MDREEREKSVLMRGKVSKSQKERKVEENYTSRSSNKETIISSTNDPPTSLSSAVVMAVVEIADGIATVRSPSLESATVRSHNLESAAFFHAQPFYPPHHHISAPPPSNRPNTTAGDDMLELEELLSKLNPMAEEFVPPSLADPRLRSVGTGTINLSGFAGSDQSSIRRKRINYNQGKRRMNSRTRLAQQEDAIRRTIYVSDIDQQVTEEHLAALFVSCGHVVDCRICGDPKSVLRFAFIEFTDEEGARAALGLTGTMLGYYPVRVLPSKTAIAPVNDTFLPRSDDEREMCARTIYCTNIDKKVSQAELKLFFESICGEVYRLRLLGDQHHSTRIAFVEFVMAGSAINALSCSGVVLGSFPIRVSPSKTPVRPRAPRQPMH